MMGQPILVAMMQAQGVSATMRDVIEALREIAGTGPIELGSMKHSAAVVARVYLAAMGVEIVDAPHGGHHGVR